MWCHCYQTHGSCIPGHMGHPINIFHTGHIFVQPSADKKSLRTGKKRIFAVQVFDVFQLNDGPIKGPLEPLNTNRVLSGVWEISGGPSIGPPWYWEMPVSRTTVRLRLIWCCYRNLVFDLNGSCLSHVLPDLGKHLVW